MIAPGPPTKPGDTEAEALATRRRVYFLGVALETLSLVTVAALIAALAVLSFFIDIDVRHLERLGYAGLFAISFIGAASVVVPMPGFAAVVGGGALLDPIAGIPAPVVVGLTAGLAEALGEFSGYAMGFGGTPMLERRRLYRLFYRWTRRYGMLAMFGFAVVPNPLFDVAGVAAGALRIPLWKFFTSVLVGKIVKDMYVAGAGALIFGVISGRFG